MLVPPAAKRRISLLFISILVLAAGMISANPPIEIWRGEKLIESTPSLQEAINAADPGDTIRVREGVYHESVVISGKNAAPQNPFVLEAAEGETVILDGADPDLQRPHSDRWEWSEEDQAWIAEVPWQGRQSRALLTWASYDDGRLIASHHDRECFLAGNRGDALWRVEDKVHLRLQGDRNPNDYSINIGTSEGILQFYNSSGWVVRGLDLKHAGFTGVHLKGPTARDIILENLTIMSSYRGISTEEYGVGFSNRITIRNCRILNFWDFEWPWKDGYRDGASSSSDEEAPMRGGGIHLRAHDSEIYGCEIAGQWDGIRIQGRNVKVYANLLHHIKDDMMELESNNSRNIQVYENIGYEVFVGFSLVSNRGGPIYIYRNWVQTGLFSRMYEDTWRYGYPLKFGSDWGPGAENIFIYQNTFDSKGRSLFVQRRSNPEKWKNIEWVNNIFSRTQDGALGIEGMGSPSQGIVWEGNLFIREEEIAKLTTFSDEYTQAGIVGDPDFIDSTQAFPDLRIGEQSDARNQGTIRPQENGWPDSVEKTDGSPDAGAVPFGAPRLQAGPNQDPYLPWTVDPASNQNNDVTDS
ncbi:right-handed parallel beta-helix repeat-containing protein [Puniceicoccus vermicola]|uniref:Right-handed parallel beta-helix repeat-containing protein n=1 Tax=Puniceicoccus vermicola TaxID=388746 RepID=A0A7X1E575_9BACT|nr:right-handed parallel beta-helix repeat-containing protein [Puniceicoccus vermicola]MBC2603365.1 right-handed parallel beta-helix repeat-containing protein [Puniceicoccus vermicola]